MASTAPDVVDLLLEQHQQIRDLFATVRASEGQAKQQAFEDLRRLLAVHETAEELVTHPRARLADGGNDVVDARLAEETASKKLLAQLDGMKVDAPGFDGVFAALETAVLEHAAAEEREEFPLLRDEVDQAQREKMASAVKVAAALAPTHPHPSVGSSMTTNLMAGPLASLVDRTRDAVNQVLGRPS
ncbi:hemerythrin domain-containing protein [Nocardioides solisilvae]|uniref:hemerythrin domain-containing protein n=1 Tax=Nocardioides solisilvae TaxID=1542435 RepID=UPI000D74282A|nr:hemerythrin domain-containing protein [Nocardioides solisilvae]